MRRRGQGFLRGLVAGFIHYAGTVYWTVRRCRHSAGFPSVVAVFVAGLLALYMAAYIAVFGAITALLVRRFRFAGFWLAPAAWVAMEYLRGILIGGFPVDSRSATRW
jgi:apolipoprotein N-acyltransferase